MRLHLLAIALLSSTLLGTTLKAVELEITPDVVYGHKHGLALTFDVFKPKTEANGAAVLFMVSGGWYSSWTPPEQAQAMFKPLTDKGFTVFAIRHGSSPKFGIAEAVDDVRRSVRFIRLNSEKFQIDADRIGVYGLSAGGHLSLMLGTTSDKGDEKSKDPVLKVSDRVAAVCAWVAPTDLREMAWSNPDHAKMYDRFPALELDTKTAKLVSPLLAVSSDDAPSLLIAGDKDDLVPIKHSYEIKKAFDSEKVDSKLVVIEGAGHGFQKDDAKKATTEMVNWFEAKLARKN